MDEYIAREPLLLIARELQGNVFGAPLIVEAIKNAPAADVTEVIHGAWRYNPNGNDWGIGAWQCSECGVKNDNLGTDNYFAPHLYAGSNYCPHCGAKMDKEIKKYEQH